MRFDKWVNYQLIIVLLFSILVILMGVSNVTKQ